MQDVDEEVDEIEWAFAASYSLLQNVEKIDIQSRFINGCNRKLRQIFSVQRLHKISIFFKVNKK